MQTNRITHRDTNNNQTNCDGHRLAKISQTEIHGSSQILNKVSSNYRLYKVIDTRTLWSGLLLYIYTLYITNGTLPYGIFI